MFMLMVAAAIRMMFIMLMTFGFMRIVRMASRLMRLNASAFLGVVAAVLTAASFE
jgi:hypothetical protein